MKKQLGIVIPVYNEENSIKKIILEWSGVLDKEFCDLIIINDGSQDNTVNILKNESENIDNLIIVNKKNNGHGSAIVTGYEYCVQNNYDFIFQTDSDDQFFADDFQKIWDCRNQNLDLILGDRVHRSDSFLRVFLSRVILKKLIKILFNKNMVDPNIPFRLVKNSFLKKYLNLDPQKYIAPNIQMSLYAENIKFIEVSHKSRKFGKKNWSLKEIIKFGIRLIKDLIRFKNEKNQH